MVDKPLHLQDNGIMHAVNEQYPLVDGTRGFTGVVSGVTPTANSHLATKQYVDSDFISTNTTFHVSTTGSDSTGDGSSGSPWATITKALEYLEDKWIAPDTTVTIQLADGNHSYSDTINFNHPCGDRISIVGTTLVELSLSSVGTISGTAPDRTIVLNVDSTTNCTAGDLIRIVPTSGGTNRKLLAGASKIVSVNSSTQLTVEWPQQTTSYTPSGSIVGDITVFKTKISHSVNGIEVIANTLGNLNTLAFEGAGALPGTSIRGWNEALVLCGSDIVVYGAYAGIYATQFAFVFADGITVGKCTYGMYTNYKGLIRAYECILNGHSNSCTLAAWGGHIRIASGILTGALNYGLYANQCGIIYGSSTEIYACHQGIRSAYSSTVDARSILISLMDNAGIISFDISYVDASYCNISYCTNSPGVLCTRQSFVRVYDGDIQYNYRGINVSYNSIVIAHLATVANNTDYDLSPSPANTVGNTESYVET